MDQSAKPDIKPFSEAAAATDTPAIVSDIRSRGRPRRPVRELTQQEERKKAFGRILAGYREDKGLKIKDVALQAGVSSPDKIRRYEGTCFPPGKMVKVLAGIYGIPERRLALLVLMYSDPDLYSAIMTNDGNIALDEQALEELFEAPDADSTSADHASGTRDARTHTDTDTCEKVNE